MYSATQYTQKQKTSVHEELTCHVFTCGLMMPTEERGKTADPRDSPNIHGSDEAARWKEGGDDSEVLESSQASPAPHSAPSPAPCPVTPLVRKGPLNPLVSFSTFLLKMQFVYMAVI